MIGFIVGGLLGAAFGVSFYYCFRHNGGEPCIIGGTTHSSSTDSEDE